MTFSQLIHMRGRAMNFDADSFPFSHFALRLQRPPGGSLCDIRENAEYFLPLRLYPYAIVVLRAVLVSHPSRAEYLVKAFPCGTARREGGVRRGGTRCARNW